MSFPNAVDPGSAALAAEHAKDHHQYNTSQGFDRVFVTSFVADAPLLDESGVMIGKEHGPEAYDNIQDHITIVNNPDTGVQSTYVARGELHTDGSGHQVVVFGAPTLESIFISENHEGNMNVEMHKLRPYDFNGDRVPDSNGHVTCDPDDVDISFEMPAQMLFVRLNDIDQKEVRTGLENDPDINRDGVKDFYQGANAHDKTASFNIGTVTPETLEHMPVGNK